MGVPSGTQLGRYEVRSLLGVGGMGEVYLAQDLQLRRLVALKLLPPQFTRDEERLRRFKQEAFAASSLNHPNIFTIFEIGQHVRYLHLVLSLERVICAIEMNVCAARPRCLSFR